MPRKISIATIAASVALLSGFAAYVMSPSRGHIPELPANDCVAGLVGAVVGAVLANAVLFFLLKDRAFRKPSLAGTGLVVLGFLVLVVLAVPQQRESWKQFRHKVRHLNPNLPGYAGPPIQETPASVEHDSHHDQTHENEPPNKKSDVASELYPDVLAVEARSTNDAGDWRFDVTLSSPYDSPERYADAWRVLDVEDQELGIRILGHDHANEQPFTRSETIQVPNNVTVVFVEGRDQANGWSGQRFEFKMPSR